MSFIDLPSDGSDQAVPLSRLVTIESIESDNGLVICYDDNGTYYEIPLGVVRVGREPRVKEKWFIDRSLGSWTLSGYLERFAQPAKEKAGVVQYFAGSTIPLPDGYLPCDGSYVAQSDYPALYDRIGDTFGAPQMPAGSVSIKSSTSSVTKLSGTDVGADGYIGVTFSLTLEPYVAGDVDVLFIACPVGGARIRNANANQDREGPHQWQSTDGRYFFRGQSGDDLSVFVLSAFRTVPQSENQYPLTFVVEFPPTTPVGKMVLTAQRHLIEQSGLSSEVPGQSNWIPHGMGEGASFLYQSGLRASKDAPPWCVLEMAGRRQTASLLMVAHTNNADGDPDLVPRGAPVTPVLSSTSRSMATRPDFDEGVRITSYWVVTKETEPEWTKIAFDPGWQKRRPAGWAILGATLDASANADAKFKLPTVNGGASLRPGISVGDQ